MVVDSVDQSKATAADQKVANMKLLWLHVIVNPILYGKVRCNFFGLCCRHLEGWLRIEKLQGRAV